MTNPYTPTAHADTLSPSATSAFRLPICDRTLTQDISGDFSLPDYQPEIKRLLRIGVSLLPPATYATADGIDLGGSMDYFVLYAGNDDMLYCAPLNTEYRISAPLADSHREENPLSGNLSAWMGDEPTCLCELTADTVTGRVTAPRRLNIKCRLNAKLKAYATCPAGVSPVNTDNTQTLAGSVGCSHLMRVVGDMLPLQDDMILAPGEGDRLRVVCAEGQVVVSEVAAAQDAVICRGDVLLKLTLSPTEVNEGRSPEVTVTHRKIPFSQAVDIPGVTPDCIACAHGACGQLSVEMEEGRLHTELGVILEAIAERDVPVTYTKDMYATRQASVGSYTDYRVEQALQCLNGNFTLSDSLPLSEVNIPPAARILDVTVTATPSDLIRERGKSKGQGKCQLSGDCRVHVIWQNQSEYGASELSLPFRYEFEDRCVHAAEGDADGTPAFHCHMQAVSCRARMDGERIGVDAELCVMLRMSRAVSVKALSQLTPGEDVSRRRGEYVICFPSGEDTLWSVAKRYSAPLTTLAVVNGLSSTPEPDAEDSLEGVRYLIV